jgi:DNA-directed RNA polymerase specialized sigma24 family protein
MPESEFEDLMAKVQDGYPRAFELFVERYGPRLKYVIRHLIKKRQLQAFLDASAINQSVLLRFQKALTEHQIEILSREKTMCFLHALAKHRVADHARQVRLEKNHRAKEGLDRIPEPEDKGCDNPCAQLIAEEQAEALRQNLTKAEWELLQEGSGGDWQGLAEKYRAGAEPLRKRFSRLFQKVLFLLKG